MGHCASYHIIQEIETELTFEANSENQLTPFGMSLENHMGTGVAWDNYDHFVETQSGKDTLHDTVGIAFQTIENPIQHAATANSKANQQRYFSDISTKKCFKKKDKCAQKEKTSI